MTQTFGRTAHHPGDGCTGAPRTLVLSDAHAIRSIGLTMVSSVCLTDGDTARAHDDIADMGAELARHYGPEGEWFLVGYLAEHTRRNAPADLRGPADLPALDHAVPPCDHQATALLVSLARRHRHTGTPDEQCGHLEAARLPLQTFMLHMHTRDYPAARALWAAVFTGSTHPLTALGFTAQLVVWAARATLPDQQGNSARHTATLN